MNTCGNSDSPGACPTAASASRPRCQAGHSGASVVMKAGSTASGDNWVGLKRNGAYRVTAVEQQQLLPPWAALLLLLGTLLLAWRMEGR